VYFRWDIFLKKRPISFKMSVEIIKPGSVIAINDQNHVMCWPASLSAAICLLNWRPLISLIVPWGSFVSGFQGSKGFKSFFA